MNDRFMNDITEIQDEYEYAEMTFILTKVIKVPPKTGSNNSDMITGECAYIDGCISDLYNSMTLKVDKLTAGRYIAFYTAKFKKDQLCRRMNTIFYAPCEVKLIRTPAKKFSKSFMEELENRNFKRSVNQNYKQPYF